MDLEYRSKLQEIIEKEFYQHEFKQTVIYRE